MPDKKMKKKKPYCAPEIKAVVFNPRDKIITGVYCDTGSGTDHVNNKCNSIYCELA